MTMKSAETPAQGQSGHTPPPRTLRLKSLDDVRVEMARVYRDARSGKMDLSKAGKLAYILVQLSNLTRDTDLERRLAHLEREANGDSETN